MNPKVEKVQLCVDCHEFFVSVETPSTPSAPKESHKQVCPYCGKLQQIDHKLCYETRQLDK